MFSVLAVFNNGTDARRLFDTQEEAIQAAKDNFGMYQDIERVSVFDLSVPRSEAVFEQVVDENTALEAKIIEITNSDEGTEYTFKAYEFENGVILIPGETSNDWFFNNREEYEPNGTDLLVSIEDTGASESFFADYLKEKIKGSESEFDYKVSKKVLELIK